MKQSKTKQKWLTMAPLGLAMVGLGLSLTGEATILKFQEAVWYEWVGLGTLGLVVFNSGLSIFGDAVKWRFWLEWEEKEARKMNQMELERDELAILKDSSFLPMKARVCQKVETQLADLLPMLRKRAQEFELPSYPQLLTSNGKISKGENYKHFAYRVLDFPNVLTKDDMFLFRSMMLWGDAYSFHFVLAGKYLELWGQKILEQKGRLKDGILLAGHDNPWLWHSTAEGWRELKAMSDEELEVEMGKRKFLKLSYFLDLQEYQRVGEVAKELLANYLSILSE